MHVQLCLIWLYNISEYCVACIIMFTAISASSYIPIQKEADILVYCRVIIINHEAKVVQVVLRVSYFPCKSRE